MNRRTLLLSGTSLLLAAGSMLAAGGTFAQDLSGPQDGAPAPAAVPEHASVAPGTARSGEAGAPGKSPVGAGGVCPVCGAPLPVALAAPVATACTGHACHG